MIKPDFLDQIMHSMKTMSHHMKMNDIKRGRRRYLSCKGNDMLAMDDILASIERLSGQKVGEYKLDHDVCVVCPALLKQEPSDFDIQCLAALAKSKGMVLGIDNQGDIWIGVYEQIQHWITGKKYHIERYVG